MNSNQPEGTTLKRPWSFKEVCADTCKIAFRRETLYGPSATWLVPHESFFTAEFPAVTVPCAYPEDSTYEQHPTGESHDTYKLWLTADDNIEAVEQRLETGCYPTPDPPNITRWKGTPNSDQVVPEDLPPSSTSN